MGLHMRVSAGVLAAGVVLAGGVYLNGSGAARADASTSTVYACAVRSQLNAWLSEEYVFVVPDTKADVVVLDSIAYHFNNETPVPATLARDDDSEVIFDWSLMVRDYKGKTAVLVYHAVYNKKFNQLDIRGSARGYVNRFVGTGNCNVTRQ